MFMKTKVQTGRLTVDRIKQQIHLLLKDKADFLVTS